MNNKRTKIVASISDERCEVEFLKQLHEAGMNVVRMNTAHATPEGLKKIIRNVRAVSNQIAILIDTKGPEVRTTACAGGAVSSALPFVLGGGPAVGLALLGVSFFFTGLTTICSTSMLMDAIDYAEYKLGFRGEGVVFSMNTFLNKLSSTLAKGLLGVSLTAMHYVDNMAPTATLTTGLSAIVYLAPAACFVLAAIPLLFYRLRPAQIESIRQDLENRRSAEK